MADSTLREQLALLAEQEARVKRETQEQTRAGPATQFPSELTSGPVNEFFIGTGEMISDRFAGLRNEIRAPDTFAANLGRAAVPTVAAVAAPMLLPAGFSAGVGGIATQGIIAAGLEATDPESTGLSIAATGTLAGLGQGTGDLGGRFLTGAMSRVSNAFLNSPIVRQLRGSAERILQTQSQPLRTMASTLGGLRSFDRAQQLIVTRAAARAIGEDAEILTGEVRNRAAQRIGLELDRGLPTEPVDITSAFITLDDIPASEFPGKARIMAQLARAEDSPEAYQQVMRSLRKVTRKSDEFSDEFLLATQELADAGVDAGAATTREAREQWKNLMLLESIPSVRNTGQVSPITANNRIFSRFGAGTSRREGEGTLPATEDFIKTVQRLSDDVARRFQNSGTPERQAQLGALQESVALLSGQGDPTSLLKTLGSFTLGPPIGVAAFGAPASGRFTGAAGAAALQGRDREDFEAAATGVVGLLQE